MSRRFNNLEDVVNTFTETQILALPANNKYRKYYEWKRDPEKRQLPEGSAPDRGRNVKMSLSPFGLPFDANARVTVDVSKRSKDNLEAVGGAILYNLLTTVPAGATKLAGFVPAKTILAKRLASPRTVSSAANRITGRAYKTSTGESYTMPFGRESATSTEFEMQSEIIASQGENYVMTFTPERRYSR
jgi:hypothetical protein